MSLLNVAVFSIVADFPVLSDSVASAAVDIHDVPNVPAAAAISDVNSVPAVVGLPVCCCQLHYSTFTIIPGFASVPTVLAFLLLLLFLLLLAFMLLF